MAFLSSAKVTIHALDRDPIACEMAVEVASTSPGLFPLLGKFSDRPNLLPVGYRGDSLNFALHCAWCAFKTDGRIVPITFHSGPDREESPAGHHGMRG